MKTDGHELLCNTWPCFSNESKKIIKTFKYFFYFFLNNKHAQVGHQSQKEGPGGESENFS